MRGEMHAAASTRYAAAAQQRNLSERSFKKRKLSSSHSSGHASRNRSSAGWGGGRECRMGVEGIREGGGRERRGLGVRAGKARKRTRTNARSLVHAQHHRGRNKSDEFTRILKETQKALSRGGTGGERVRRRGNGVGGAMGMSASEKLRRKKQQVRWIGYTCACACERARACMRVRARTCMCADADRRGPHPHTHRCSEGPRS